MRCAETPAGHGRCRVRRVYGCVYRKLFRNSFYGHPAGYFTSGSSSDSIRQDSEPSFGDGRYAVFVHILGPALDGDVEEGQLHNYGFLYLTSR